MPGRNGQLTEDRGNHVVQFYGSDEELAGSVSAYLGEGLRAGGSALMVATTAHQAGFRSKLDAAGIDVGAGEAAGRLLVLNADETLSRFCRGGRLDHAQFRAVADEMIGRAAAAGQPVRIYAEMVALLWDAGQVIWTLELEALWNELSARLPFSLLCGYPAAVVAGSEAEGALEEVCRLHASVAGSPVGTPGAAGTGKGSLVERRFPRDDEAPRAARHFVTNALESCGDDQALVADAAIVTTELAANAVRHARSGFTVTVSRSAAGVRISVRDQTPIPANGDGPLMSREGHGLDLIAKIASSWAVEPLPDGKVVWAQLPASPDWRGDVR
jgi:anti-sigma regulatory factor (Ser/Thr protein kinase)